MDVLDSDKIAGLLERLIEGGHGVDEDEVLSFVTKIVQICQVPTLEKTEDVPYEESDFVGVADTAEYHLGVLCRIIEELHRSQKKGKQFSVLFKKNVVVSCVLVTSEFVEPDWEWSSDRTASVAKSVAENVCLLANCCTLGELLNGVRSDVVCDSDPGESSNSAENVNYLENILQTLASTLNKKSWKSCAASKASYWFILTQLDQQNLGDSLAYLLPPALFIVDDWEERNKILGLKCLHHILKNTPGSEIRWYGRSVVIYEAIKLLLHSREVKVLEALYPTIILAAEVLEADPQYTGQLRSKSSFDAIILQVLQEMSYEQKLILRVVYSSVLPPLLNAMGILALKWSEEIIPMCENYLATFSGSLAEDRINILLGLQVYIRKCWPQVHVHAGPILKMIVRLLYDATDKEFGLDEEVAGNLVKEALKVVHLLHAAAPKTTKDFYAGVADMEVHPNCQILLKEIEEIVSSDI